MLIAARSPYWIDLSRTRRSGSCRRTNTSARRRRHGPLGDGPRGRLEDPHGLVDAYARRHRAAGGVDVKLDVLVGILGLQEEHLGDDQVGDLVLDVGREEDDPLLEEAGEDVVRPLPARGQFDHNRNQSHPAPPCHLSQDPLFRTPELRRYLLTFEYSTYATGLDAPCRQPPRNTHPYLIHIFSYPQASELLGVTRSHGCGRLKRRSIHPPPARRQNVGYSTGSREPRGARTGI